METTREVLTRLRDAATRAAEASTAHAGVLRDSLTAVAPILVALRQKSLDETEADAARHRREAEVLDGLLGTLPRDLAELDTLDEFLAEEGILDEVTERAQARVDAMKGETDAQA